MAARPLPSSPWLAAAREGDPEAFDRLLRPMLGALLALARRLSGGRAQRADELLQEALIRAHRGIASFRGACSFRSWMVGILYRLSTQPERFDAARPLPGQQRLEDCQVEIPERLGEDPVLQVSARDSLHRVEEAMERLPYGQRTALHLRAVEGWSYEEIAVALDASPGAMRQAVLKARRKLRDRLEGQLLGDEAGRDDPSRGGQR